MLQLIFNTFQHTNKCNLVKALLKQKTPLNLLIIAGS